MKRIRAWNIRAWNRLECYLTRLNVYNLVEFWFELVGTTYYLRILLVEINIKEQFISYLSTFKDFSSYIFKLFVVYTSMLPSSLLYEKAWHFHFSFCNCVLEHAANAPFHFLETFIEDIISRLLDHSVLLCISGFYNVPASCSLILAPCKPVATAALHQKAFHFIWTSCIYRMVKLKGRCLWACLSLFQFAGMFRIWK